MSLDLSCERIETARLALEPLERAHAALMYGLLQDAELYRFLDEGAPASLDWLIERYERLARRCNPAGTEVWLNWIVFERARPERRPLGYIQATIAASSTPIAYVLATRERSQGYATESVAAMLAYLTRSRPTITTFCATVDRRHRKSIAVLERLGFEAQPAAPDDTDLRFERRV